MSTDQPQVDSSKIKLIPYSTETAFADFDCGNPDLNNFIKDDALKHQAQNVAETTCIFYEDEPIGYYTLVCDSLDGELITKSQKRKLFSQKKRSLQSYPAIKLARFAVKKEHQKKGIGSFIVKLIQGYTWDLKKKGVGCRFVTVDAYPQTVGFYEKNGFNYNIMDEKKQKSDDTISMRLDILK